MTAEEFISSFETLFIESDESSKEFIINRLSNQRTNLVSMVNQMDDEAERYFSVQKSTVVKNIRELYAVIIGSVNLFLNGQFAKSRDKIYTKFFDRENTDRSPLPTKGIDVEAMEKFFRMRSNETYNLYKRKEMFHIPFEKRGSVTNQRFSISGYPCLYLGSSLYCCWEEVRRPDIEMSNIVSLKNTCHLQFIDLTIPTLSLLEFSETSIYRLVLPLACSLKVHDSDDTFKAEYIIPQNVLSCVVHRNSDDVTIFDGVMYTSNIYGRAECLFNDDKARLINYVVPIKTSAEKGLCQGLVNMFQVSEPTSMLIERLKENVRDVFLPYGDESLDIYRKTIWGVTEELILKKPHEIIS